MLESLMGGSADQLRRAVEDEHGGTAVFVDALPLKQIWNGQTVWEGVVHTYDLEGHPRATRAYAWFSAIEGGDRRRIYTVLHLGGIQSPLDAVRDAMLAERQTARIAMPESTRDKSHDLALLDAAIGRVTAALAMDAVRGDDREKLMRELKILSEMRREIADDPN